MKPRVCILDYGSGNVRSVSNSLSHMGVEWSISNQTRDIETSTHLILPGVGAFGSAMRKIREQLPIGLIEKKVSQDRLPLLGICVGMQVLADVGHEFGSHSGLGWIPGEVDKINSKGKLLPHIGWNEIDHQTQCPLLDGIDTKTDFYFVHSFAFRLLDMTLVKATVEYGTHFTAVVQKDNLFGVQFHPEKSQLAGMKVFENFLRYNYE